MATKPIVFYRGKVYVVECAIRLNGSCEGKAFLDALDNKSKAKIVRTIKRLADFGHIRSREQYKKVEGDVWEFKEFQTRIPMYHCAPGCIALTHGFFKKTEKMPKSQLRRAEQIMLEYNKVRKGFRNEQGDTV